MLSITCPLAPFPVVPRRGRSTPAVTPVPQTTGRRGLAAGAGLAWLTLCLAALPAQAQQLVGLRLDRNRVVPAEFFELAIDLSLPPGGRCGVQVQFGDGEQRDINAERRLELLYKKFERPGRYTIRAVGQRLSRGLFSAEPCGNQLSVTIDVIDTAAQANRDYERDARLRQREVELERRAGALNAREDQLSQREAEAQTRQQEAGRKLELQLQRLAAREAQLAAKIAAVGAAPSPAAPVMPPTAVIKASAPRKDNALSVWTGPGSGK